MRYMLLIYTKEADEGQATAAERESVMQAYNAFTKEVQDRGVFVGGEALHPTSSATTVRAKNGKAVTTDGPFAETKEQLGGYYILNCKDLNEAIQYAGKIPGAKFGSIEVRPIMEYN
jgi:hypothetical protein